MTERAQSNVGFAPEATIPKWRDGPCVDGSKLARRIFTSQAWSETHDPLIADACNFYKVEKWTKDGSKVDSLVFAGSNLDKAREIFAEAIYRRPRIPLTIRQRERVLEQWPPLGGANVLRWHQPHLVAKLREFTCPIVRCRAGLHTHKAMRQRLEERQYLAAPKLLPNDDLPRRFHEPGTHS
jgi:hypothetical protein